MCCPRNEVGTMSESWGVSIIVVNYNNAEFLAPAIDSALCQQYPICEVIVVDDCSTDASRAVIARYGDRIRFMLREQNGGQVVAQDSAWPLARYPILIFLDSDDLLFPHVAATVARIWTPATVKVQFPLATIDKAGRRLGHIAPKYPANLDTATIRKELLRTGGSPNSPGSGNAYSRSLLESISADGGFELENSRNYHMDALLECNAPFYGEVVTLYDPLSFYRIHDSNMFAMNSIENARFAMKCRTFELKVDYLARRCKIWGIPFDPVAARNGSIWLHECRLAAAKITGDHGEESIFTTLCWAVRACIRAQLPPVNRTLRIMWFLSVAAAPRALARWLIAFRFVPSRRPAWFERFLTTVVNIANWRGSARAHAD
jgi:glycosyltransferase involved in cell wall biosynthesis